MLPTKFKIIEILIENLLDSRYNKHMKRANLILDENLLKTASSLFNEKTYSGTVNRALDEAIKAVKIRGLLEFSGSGLWEGDLSEMREDSPKKKKTIKKRN